MTDCDYTEEEGGGGGRKREGEREGRQKGRERREIILVITSTCYTHCLTSSSLNNIILLKYIATYRYTFVALEQNTY